MDVASDLAILMRNIAAEVSFGRGSPTYALFGRVASYDPTTDRTQVQVVHWGPTQQDQLIISIPTSGEMKGDGYGDYFYPDEGTLCLVLLVERSTGDSISLQLLNDDVNQPPSWGSGIAAKLTPGERIIWSKSGFLARFNAAGKLQLGSTSGGTTPVAVEGSSVTHNHTLVQFYAELATAIANYIIANPPTAASCGLTDVAAIFAALAAPTPVPTDTAGDTTMPGVLTTAVVDTATEGTGGAQSVLAPGPGGS